MGVVKERETFGKCPACGGDVLEGEKSFYCSNYKEETGGCKVHVPKLIMGTTFGKQEVEAIVKSGESNLRQGMTKDGNEVEFQIVYDEEKKDFVPRFKGDQVPIGVCPKCGKPVFVGSKSYFCSGYKDEPKCTFSVWKETEGTKFSSEDVRRMLAGETLADVSCFTKEGKEYKCGFRIDKDTGDIVKISYGGTKKEEAGD